MRPYPHFRVSSYCAYTDKKRVMQETSISLLVNNHVFTTAAYNPIRIARTSACHCESTIWITKYGRILKIYVVESEKLWVILESQYFLQILYNIFYKIFWEGPSATQKLPATVTAIINTITAWKMVRQRPIRVFSRYNFTFAPSFSSILYSNC
jgi:hypothetical protein